MYQCDVQYFTYLLRDVANIRDASHVTLPIIYRKIIKQATFVQRLDNTIHCINLYLLDSAVHFVITYVLDSDLFKG